MHKQTVRDIDLRGKRVVVRVDYNVPVHDGQVGDTLRIEASFDTLRYLLDQDCAIVLLAHLGEPKGAPDPKLSLAPVAAKAAELLGQTINFVNNCIGSEAEKATEALQPGQIVMLENVRFHQEELDNDAAFAKMLAGYGEVFVNDAFAVCHRKQASVVGIAAHLPAVAGLLVAKEVDYITGALATPNRPLVAVVGGAKISSKIGVVDHLVQKVDILMIGGAMANTFYLAQGYKVGRSLVEADQVETAKRVLTDAAERSIAVVLPQEIVVSKSLEEAQNLRETGLDGVEDDDYIVDAAPSFGNVLGDSIQEVLDFDKQATVLWNGPLGITEVAEFAGGSRAMADAIIQVKAISILGGGDTAAFVDGAGLHDKFTWVSTGGGASLELMSGNTLPGVEALLDA